MLTSSNSDADCDYAANSQGFGVIAPAGVKQQSSAECQMKAYELQMFDPHLNANRRIISTPKSLVYFSSYLRLRFLKTSFFVSASSLRQRRRLCVSFIQFDDGDNRNWRQQGSIRFLVLFSWTSLPSRHLQVAVYSELFTCTANQIETIFLGSEVTLMRWFEIAFPQSIVARIWLHFSGAQSWLLRDSLNCWKLEAPWFVIFAWNSIKNCARMMRKQTQR